MDNRGSKSKCTDLTTVKTISEKEQRVDGNWSLFKEIHNVGISILNFKLLRFTLMGLETGYQVKIPSKQLNNKKFSTLSFQPKLNPW